MRGGRSRGSALVSALCWTVLGALLLALYFFTSIGTRSVPEGPSCLDADCAAAAPVPLERAPRSPLHRLVPARIAGESVRFLLDTGASETVLARTAAERIGLAAEARTILGAVNASYALMSVVRIESLELGAHAFSDFDAAILDLAHVRTALGAEIAGVIGANLLARQPFEIDFGGDLLRLGRPLAAFLDEGGDGARSGGAFPLDEVAGGYFAEVRVNGQPLAFLLDTGAVPTTLERDVELGSDAPAPGSARSLRVDATGAEVTEVENAVLGSLALGPVERPDFPVALGVANLLGADFFEGLVLRVEPEAGRAFLRRSAPGSGGASPPAEEARPE